MRVFMDIASLVHMGQASSSSSSSLNDDFGATTPAGDSIFSKALGSRTVFRTPNKGALIASFVFDPKQRYTDNHIMASVITDYMSELRDGLTRYLLDPKDIVPKTKTLEETLWEHYTTLPKGTLKFLFNDPTIFSAYKTHIAQSVGKTYHEEEVLTKHMSEKPFSYAMEIAIDAYPGEKESHVKDSNQPRMGVLTFHLEGIPDGNVALAKETKEEEDGAKTKKRKTDGEQKRSEKEQLLYDLSLTDYYGHAHVDSVKEFPPTASQFFEELGRWFTSVVTRRSAKLEKDQSRNHLYH